MFLFSQIVEHVHFQGEVTHGKLLSDLEPQLQIVCKRTRLMAG